MAPIPIPPGPRSRIRLQPPRRRSRTLAAILTEIKKARATFDTSETHKSFGVYEQVQARVNANYDN
ncbi:hypothetical protein PILCRDRAFT_646554 [Piloderma croceum F 1598]|uniref:Uncharacterized protein n=1 Tax=Piloderma croceum (strain F 1598) TaxID=765440 RepID=A0A0C3EUY7_PILCF|nr:hypothetical protein PILCRDRAFT_646554 [Piloderma croceum F 1598]